MVVVNAEIGTVNHFQKGSVDIFDFDPLPHQNIVSSIN